MKKLLVLISLILMISPAIAGRPKLRGPSSPRQQHIVYINIGHHNRVCVNRYSSSYRSLQYNNKTYRIHKQHRQVIVIIQRTPIRRINPAPKPRIIPKPRFKIVRVNPKPRIKTARVDLEQIRHTKTRAQTISESKSKAQSYVYKKMNERSKQASK